MIVISDACSQLLCIQTLLNFLSPGSCYHPYIHFLIQRIFSYLFTHFFAIASAMKSTKVQTLGAGHAVVYSYEVETLDI